VLKKLHADGRLTKTPEQKIATSRRMKKWHTEHGHPRGALGLQHTDAAKNKMSVSSKKYWANLSQPERDRISKRMSVAAARNAGKLENRKNASWKAGWREIGGARKYYRSRWEANYARYLEWLKQNGEIAAWAHEPKTFWFEKIKRGTMSYLPDFSVQENSGPVVYHEVKGWMDDRSKTKIKRMAKYFPEIQLIVVDSKQYKLIEKSVGKIIVGWEQCRADVV